MKDEFSSIPSTTNLFKEFHNAMRELCKPRMFYPNRRMRAGGSFVKNPPYVRPIHEGEVKGKLNIKAAKRAHVRLMKAEAK